MLKKMVLSVVILAIVALVMVYLIRNMLVEKAVEAGSAYALGVETDLSSASLEISGGSLELNNLEISNPEGFTADNFLSLRKGIFDVDAGSVLDDEVVVDSFIIEGITLNLEQIDNKGNYQVLLDHIKTARYVIIGRIPEIPHRFDRPARYKRNRLARSAGK